MIIKNEMDNPTFVNEEDILMVNQEEDYYDDYRTLDTSRVDETSFTVPDTAGATLTVQLKQKVKRDKLSALYRHLNVTGSPALIDLDRFRLTKDPKKRSHTF